MELLMLAVAVVVDILQVKVQLKLVRVVQV
jgi:hypothetical protein